MTLPPANKDGHHPLKGGWLIEALRVDRRGQFLLKDPEGKPLQWGQWSAVYFPSAERAFEVFNALPK